MAELFDQAVERSRLAEDDTEDRWALLRPAAGAGRVAVRMALGQLTDPDAVVRAVACDLLGVVSEVGEDDVRGEVATALVALAAHESDPAVQRSIARAGAATCDPAVLPVLLTLAGSPDIDVRFQVAVALPMVLLDDHPPEDAVAVLIGLCTDSDPDVREWATFGLGWSATPDGDDVRRALWDRTRDVEPGVREEGARGLARRRDARALPLVRELLARDEVHTHTFKAAAYLADPSLLPLLDGFDPTADGVAEALRECDPVRRAERDEAAWQVITTLYRLRPDLPVVILGERCDLGLFLDIGDDPDSSGRCFVDALLDRVGYDPARAAELVLEIL